VEKGKRADVYLEVRKRRGIYFLNETSACGNPGPCVSGAVLYPGDNEGISLKRQVAQRGSILLAELVAILMVLDCIAALKDGFTDIKILSDSQTAVGILTLNWKSSNYIDTISDIKENIGTLMRYGMRTTLSWIPGHEYNRERDSGPTGKGNNVPK
jgi:ribonuclease HI